MSLDPTTTLAAIVTASPATAPVLDGLGLDYCCGGGRTLGAACAEVDLDPAEVIATLDRVSTTAREEPGAPERAWASFGPAQMVDHLEATHHAYLHDALPRLTALVDKVTAVHGERHPELLHVQGAFGALRDELEPHLMKEERVLFPMVRELAEASELPQFHCGSLVNPIRAMSVEHDHAGEVLATLRHLTGGYVPPEDACASYEALYRGLAELEADTHLHVHKENNVLFPAVVALEADLSG